MQIPGQVGAVNQKRINREKYRLRDWPVGNEIKSPACKQRTAGQWIAGENYRAGSDAAKAQIIEQITAPNRDPLTMSHPYVLTKDRIITRLRGQNVSQSFSVIYDQIARGRNASQKSRLAKSSKVSRESIAADAPPSRRASPDKSGSMPEDDDAGHKHSRDKREEATSTTALRWTVIPMIRKREI
ncbi:hypothetical protein G5I_04723 [Acromyrmex echinatior]|uniref:Uncharacterized protein n=1 Tax=Acromyrmex echinatior TaxID=103372 RepID=F4WGE8_ACREC|nr:hypothetical protein G5I_04723 [Acromyrmex echinatior]